MNAALYILLLLTTTTVTIVTGTNSVVGTIKGNTTWFLSNLSRVPAKMASLEYHVQYPYEEGRTRPIITFYYNGQNSPNLVTKCARDMYGQLRNEDLAVPLNEVYRDKFICYYDSESWYCSGKTKIQDFEPKSFSFCFDCGKVHRGNLNGLYYNVTIYDESNKTSCVDLNMTQGQRIDRCERSYQYAAIPNQIGGTDTDTTRWKLGQALGILDRIMDLVQVKYKSCLTELYQVLCLVALPKCLPEQNEIVLPCREYCESLLHNCLKMDPLAQLAEEFLVNCKYLPPLKDNGHCLMKDEVCGPPPKPDHGYIMGGNIPYGREGQVVQYKCDIMYWRMEGSPNSICQASGEWTDPPTCSNNVW